jgi:hypothetical protein
MTRLRGMFAPVALTVLLAVTVPVEAQFPDAHENPPPGWTGPVFRLRQDYPPTRPAAETYPWRAVSFRTQPVEYLRRVLAYAYEGNVAVEWEPQRNSVRGWYHAPWMHAGTQGREFVHGLTKERNSAPRELHPSQSTRFQNWAVSLYNPPGGFVIGRVWRNPTSPNVNSVRFPEGTVAVKLLFTEASVAEVPYLSGSAEWQANIHQSLNSTQRTIRALRLLQIDVAVRDTRANPTGGWVFGTFVYDGNAAGGTPWDRMVPVGLMWGNDPGVTPTMVNQGTQLRESLINQPAMSVMQHLGWAGRLNGPVDNPISACLSCHSTAQWPQNSSVVPSGSEQARLRWFRNLRRGEPFDEGSRTVDYSLQLSVGMRNFMNSRPASRSGGDDD